MIHDYMTAEKFSRIKLPKLKGHVKIVLKNVKTGKTETAFEGDNLITNAVSDIFASNYCGSLDYRQLVPLYAKMFGGILLFKNQLDVTSQDAADDYFIPDNGVNQVTAHAGQTTFSSQADDVTRGNPLSTAMVTTDGAVTLAFEWGTAAGNGEIKSVGLTHSDVGDAGTGSSSVAFSTMHPVINANLGLTGNTAYMPLFVDSDGYGYRFSSSGTTVSIKKFPMAYKKVGLVADLSFTSIQYATTHNVTTSTSFDYEPFFAFDGANKKLWLFFTGRGAATTNVKCECIDLTTWTATNKNFTADIAVSAWNENVPTAVPFANGCAYLFALIDPVANTQKMLRVNLASTADQTEMTATFYPLGGAFRPNAANRIIAGKGFVINNNVVYPATPSSPDTYRQSYAIILAAPHMAEGSGLVNLAYQRGDNATGVYNAISKFYLATKYNLPSTITKTNSQSMVVTYTLTEVSS